MKTNEFKKLIRENKNNLQKIINMYCMNEIYLTEKQIEEVLRLRGER